MLDLEILIVLITTSFSKSCNVRQNSEILLELKLILYCQHINHHPCGFHVPYFRKKEKFCPLNKGLELESAYMDADLQNTSSAHATKFNESFLACPWPCQECVTCGGIKSTGEYAVDQPLTSFPHPAVALKVTLPAHVFLYTHNCPEFWL